MGQIFEAFSEYLNFNVNFFLEPIFPYVEGASYLQVIKFCFVKISQSNFMFEFWFFDHPESTNPDLFPRNF